MSETEQIIELARSLGMPRLAADTPDLLADEATDHLTRAALMLKILTAEAESRTLAAQRRRIRAAAFPQLKYLHELSEEDLPKDARTALPALKTLEFIRQGRNLILYGNPGTGKTHLAIALGIQAAQQGHSVLFTSVPRLITTIREARSSLKLSQLQNKFEKYDLVICDELGYVSCDKAGAESLFNHPSLRAEKNP